MSDLAKRRMPGLQITPLLILLFLVGTSTAAGQSNSSLSPFQGSWSFTFSAALKGSGTMQIGEDGEIALHVMLGKYDRFFTNPIVLTVSDAGTITGSIFLWVVAVGRVEGRFSTSGDLYGRVSTPFFNAGSVSGHLAGNRGDGTYQSIAGNGTWTAWKN
jgi:hypothetical protein